MPIKLGAPIRRGFYFDTRDKDLFAVMRRGSGSGSYWEIIKVSTEDSIPDYSARVSEVNISAVPIELEDLIGQVILHRRLEQRCFETISDRRDTFLSNYLLFNLVKSNLAAKYMALMSYPGVLDLRKDMPRVMEAFDKALSMDFNNLIIKYLNKPIKRRDSTEIF